MRFRPRPLDKYVFSEWWRIFTVFTLGFPVLVILIDLTDNLDKYLDRGLPRANIALSYLYGLPETMFLILPAAVLFATVFTVGALTRHSEITAAKATGISFYRVVAPVFVGAVMAALGGLALGELTPLTNTERSELLGERYRSGSTRFNFAYAAEQGRVYKVAMLDAVARTMDGLEVERKGQGADYPTTVLVAREGEWMEDSGWVLRNGGLHVIPDSGASVVVQFEEARDRQMTEEPTDLMEAPRDPQDLGYEDLGRYIAALERSGGDANTLRVERALKIAVPITSIIIALFGAPLATSTQRGGAAYGVGISLGTTVVFLMLIQLTKAVGGNGIVIPEVAAWIPSMIFGALGTWLMLRVRT
ncbi:MAG TPA: LptF/LptG family permease [Gemmatimonadaceae bacterium]|nr:LptF/LptG family permease [Gemmatimonadaceae bacterium]